MRARIVRVICKFKYFRLDYLLLEGVVGKKPKYSRKAFVEERRQKHQRKKIQAKLLVTKKLLNKS